MMMGTMAVTAIAIARQRSLSGDLWLMLSAALLPGALLSWGAATFSPGMGFALSNVTPQFLQAVASFLVIILLQTLNAWGKENGRTTHRLTRTIALVRRHDRELSPASAAFERSLSETLRPAPIR